MKIQSKSRKREMHPLAVQVLALLKAHEPKFTPFKFHLGDQVRVQQGEFDWTGEVCYRARDTWGGGDNFYEVTNAPRGMVKGMWLPVASEENMTIVESYKGRGFELFDRVRVNHPTRGVWIGHVLAFRRDDGKQEYEVEGAPDQTPDGRFLPFVDESMMTMIAPAFSEFTSHSDDWE